jgi:hypothetical protein
VAYRYKCDFYPAYLSECETILNLFNHVASGYIQSFLQPLSIGNKVSTYAFQDRGKNTFDPVSYYPDKFKAFPHVDYDYGIVIDLVINRHEQSFEDSNYSYVLIALVSPDVKIAIASNIKFIQRLNPSPRTMNW